LSELRQHLWEGAAEREAAGKRPCDIAWTALKDSAPAPAPAPALAAEVDAEAARGERVARLEGAAGDGE
jgi:hypothetical protein